MSLPSKYAPGGLSELEQHRTITVGRNVSRPVDYVVKTVEKSPNTVNDNLYQEDVEMMVEENDADAISSYLAYSRSVASNDATTASVADPGDDIDIDTDTRGEFELVKGNVSYLVVDTNFLISHLNIVDELKSMADEFELKLIIPTTVVKELDGLKSSDKQISDISHDSGSTLSLGFVARKVIEWVYSSLANNSTVVKGQKLSQKLDPHSFQDDSILDCCLYFQKHYTDVFVILLSNDKNLCLKALSNDIKTVSFRKGMTARLIAQVIHDENVAIFGQIEKEGKVYVKHTEPTQKVPQPSHQWIESTEDTSGIESVENAIATVYREVQAITISAVHHCMETAYGEDLELVKDYDHSSVSTLQDCANVMIRFWFPVFQDYFKLYKEDPFEDPSIGSTGSRKAQRLPKFIAVPQSLEELGKFVDFWCLILKVIYNAVMNEAQNQALVHLANRWTKLSTVT